MKRFRLFLATVGVFLALNLWLGVEPAAARTFDSVYELTPESNYIEGCYNPCDCPIFMNETLQGRFVLSNVSQTADRAVFEVTAIEWQFRQGDEIKLVSGSGSYEIDSGQQRMRLDLVVSGYPERRFDSGWVPLLNDLPRISVAVAVNNFFCYDYVFTINAVPRPVATSESTWGSLKAVYR